MFPRLFPFPHGKGLGVRLARIDNRSLRRLPFGVMLYALISSPCEGEDEGEGPYAARRLHPFSLHWLPVPTGARFGILRPLISRVTRDVPLGTLRSIIRQAGLTVERFSALL